MKNKALCLILAVILLLPAVLCACGTKYETAMSYHGISLTEDKYAYWMATFKKNILNGYSDARDTAAFWSAPYDGERTVEDYFTGVINARIRCYLVAQDLYKQNRLTLESGVRQQIEDDIAEKIDYYGGKKALNDELSSLLLTVDSLKDVYLWEEKYQAVYRYYFGENGIAEVTDEELTAYYESHYSRIRYIVFYLTGIETDENGDYVYGDDGQLKTVELTAEEAAEKQRKIAECEEKLRAGEDFDALREAYSEYDTSSHPNGFYVSSNDLATWGPGIVSGANNAAVGETFRVNEDEAVFLVRKEELTPLTSLSDEETAQLTQLFSYASREKADAFFAGLAAEIEVNEAILERYPLSQIKPNPYYGI